MSNGNDSQQQALAVVLTVVTAAVLAQFTTAQIALIIRFGTLITKYGPTDLLLAQLRKAARAAVAELDQTVPAMVTQLVQSAADGGAKAADDTAAQASSAAEATVPSEPETGVPTPEPSAGGPGEPVKPLFGLAGDSYESHAERSARAIREDLQGKLNRLGYRITRFADDAYRAVTADAAISQVLGLTPAQAQHDAYTKLMRDGIDGFVDSKGRNWELSAYVDAAVRTAAQRAYNVSHLDRMLSVGIQYFYVADDGHPCPLCAPWQNVVLTAGVPDDVAQHTIEEATGAGLFHPRCKHTLVAFTPGISKIPAPHKWNAEDQAKYDESQKQRALERAIRAAKRELDGAFTPEMKTAANKRVRTAHATMRQFIDQTGRVRITRREQLHL